MTGGELDLFPSEIRLNSGADKAEWDLWRWLDSFGLCRSERTRSNVRASRVAYCIGLYYPSAPLESLVLISRFTGWSLLIDEEFDAGPAGRDPAACLAAVTGLVDVFGRAAAPSREAMPRAATALWERLAPRRSAAWKARFRTHMANWLWGFYTETMDRAVGRLPDLPEFHERRREMFGAPWYLDLCEVAIGVDLPDAVHRLPAFRALSAAVADTTALCNDRVSADRERAVGYFHNAVCLLEHHRGWPPDKAAAQVDRMITEGVDRITAAYRDLPHQLDRSGLPEQAVEAALRCADAYLDVVRGNHGYHRTSGRYTRSELLPPGADLVEGFARPAAQGLSAAPEPS
ncbi:terpene synthase family protein [Streptomyces sp. TRM68416]|uniref:terpene synthase family protein n=1 Tax=Streptomyces sp. TRM68416 TaxID=2758412 RepID=UPI0016619022|nr:terpene synthase family protein [Streptomyces sp. TRM68416]MBD0844323.1 terpene cyclase [Streptomyces sp. TRM68416]